MTFLAIGPTHLHPAQPQPHLSQIPSPFFCRFTILQAKMEAATKRSSNTAKKMGKRMLSLMESPLEKKTEDTDAAWLTFGPYPIYLIARRAIYLLICGFQTGNPHS